MDFFHQVFRYTFRPKIAAIVSFHGNGMMLKVIIRTLNELYVTS
jgi:hypothetical protein